MSELLWTAVPAGAVSGGRAPLRVLVVPRLSRPTLEGNGMADWPATLEQARVEVQLRDQNGAAVTVPHTRVHQARTDVWQGFFSRGIHVEPWTGQRVYEAPEVTPTSRLAHGIETTYQASAAAVAEPRVVREKLAGLGWIDAPEQPPAAGGPPPGWSPPDFHRAVAMLREHPAVLVALGLVFEVTVDLGDLPERPPASPGAVRVVWPQPPIEATITSPWTAYEFDGHAFLPASGPDIASGVVDLGARQADGSARWEVRTFDVDGAAGRLRDAAPAIRSAYPGATTLPALRSAGLLLLRRDQAANLALRAGNGSANAVRSSLAEGPDLTAEQLVLGYRVDIRLQGSGLWRPLCLRKAGYFVDERPIAPPASEEGHVKAHAAVRNPADGSLRADEVVARWDGWSLAIPRPPLIGQRVAEPSARAAALPYTFRWDFGMVEALPELRFGTAYQMRVRVADLAGGGLRHDDPFADRGATALVPYLRHEPVSPPETGIPGDAGLLVIRSDLDLTPEELAARREYPANDSRALVAPRIGFALAEQHGVLDGDDPDTARLAERAFSAGAAGGRPPPLPDPASAGLTVHLVAGPGGPERPGTERRDWTGQWPDPAAKTITLVPGRPGSPPAFRWTDDDRVAVTLAPGRQVTVELSCHVAQGELGLFAIKPWLPEAADAAAIAGRHPDVTPARTLTLVHAVRRPLGKPAGTLLPVRGEGETAAVLKHDAAPLLGVDPESTVQLDVHASWEEWEDHPTQRQVSTLVRSLPVDRGATALDELRQEFGDTRHRRVTYTLTAVSRFRQHFDKDEAASAFLSTTTLPEVGVLNTVRPAHPQVLSVRPAFRWEGDDIVGRHQQFVRTRLGGLLRVELARPWYTTGKGEQLAVVVWPDDGEPPDDLRPFLTWIGGDPIWSTPAPAHRASPSMFSETSQETRRKVTHPETGHEVHVLPYRVDIVDDHSRGWYADVGLPAAATRSYCPFVKLAVARYQPDSLDELKLSPVVTTDFAPVLPDRKLTIDRDAAGLRVLLTGIGPDGPRPNRVTAVLERCELPPGADPAEVDIVALGQDTRGLVAWTRVPDTAVTGGLNAPLPPVPVPAGPGRLRIVVREAEQIEADGPDDSAAELTERTVYLDIVPLEQ